MPIYTYRCESCGVQFERHQSFTDEPLKRCPECNKNRLRKVLTPAGIVFKGSGWYATDHKTTSGLNRPAKTENKESTSAGASSSESSGSSSSSESSGSGSAKNESTGNTGSGSSAKSESSGNSGSGSNNKRESSSKSNE